MGWVGLGWVGLGGFGEIGNGRTYREDGWMRRKVLMGCW